mmetsp:Transcript_35599/g.47798  ORF Transcript_35599/g.47798 Transcript_35599/m.47798 type:complete len:228 (-) Transcript_35599:835-1518(-)
MDQLMLLLKVRREMEHLQLHHVSIMMNLKIHHHGMIYQTIKVRRTRILAVMMLLLLLLMQDTVATTMKGLFPLQQLRTITIARLHRLMMLWIQPMISWEIWDWMESMTEWMTWITSFNKHRMKLLKRKIRIPKNTKPRKALLPTRPKISESRKKAEKILMLLRPHLTLLLLLTPRNGRRNDNQRKTLLKPNHVKPTTVPNLLLLVTERMNSTAHIHPHQWLRSSFIY